MTYLYIMASAFLLALFVPLLVDFLFILNRLSIFSPLKNNIAHSNLYALKKELAQFFLRKPGSTLTECFLFGGLLWINFFLFFMSLSGLAGKGMAFKGHVVSIFMVVFPMVIIITTILKAFESDILNFPEVLGDLSFKVSSAVMATCFVLLSYREGSFHFSTILFIIGFEFLLYLSAVESISSMAQRPFKSHCFSGARIGLNFFTIMVLAENISLTLGPEILLYALGYSFFIELLLRVFSGACSSLDDQIMERSRKAIQLIFIVSIGWRLVG